MWIAPIWIAVLSSGAAATTAIASAPAASALDFAASRGGASLNGRWHTIVDPYENGFYDYRQQPRAHGYFDDAPPANKSDLVEYDFARSPELDVPGDWNTQRPELLYYEGTIWYERRFDWTRTQVAAAVCSCSSARRRNGRSSGSTASGSASTKAASRRSRSR